MNVVVLRDADEAQRFLLQSLWMQRAHPPAANTVKQILEWTLEISAGGQPILPTGIVADLGHAAYGSEHESRSAKDFPSLPGLSPGQIRAYEDHVLGKVYADWSFERASDAMRRFQGRDRARALAYVVRQFRDRANFGGVELSPGTIRTLLDMAPEEVLRKGWERWTADGPMPLLMDMYDGLVLACRRMAEVLGLEDIIALEHRTALADMGQYVAHRQVLQVAQRMEDLLPRHPVKPSGQREEVPTRVIDEDTYPVGGYTSLSTKGSIESLLHSQLAYMEKEVEHRPDLFDIKFLRDELYYYSRDENQFRRRRRTFLFVLYPDLVKARFKDAELPFQRIVMVLGLMLAAERKLTAWLSNDALKFQILFLKQGDEKPLAQEAALAEMLFREGIENETVEVKHYYGDVATYADQAAHRSWCQVLTLSTQPITLEPKLAEATPLTVTGPTPQIPHSLDVSGVQSEHDAFDTWSACLEKLLMRWV
jgi:hypothetical protein